MTVSDPTRIDITLDPQQRRMRGVAMHGGTPFDMPFISGIAPNLWQGGCQDGLILPERFRHLVSLYPWESYRIEHRLDSMLLAWMFDAEDQDLSRIDSIAAWVNVCRKTGPVLVNCQAGLNRSSLVTAKALILGGMPPADAVALIREKRSPACLCNPAFLEWVLGEPDGDQGYAAGCTRVYTHYGTVAHLRPPRIGDRSVLCPVEPSWPGGWLGTGDQAEYDRAASLPLCSRCAGIAGSATAVLAASPGGAQ